MKQKSSKLIPFSPLLFSWCQVRPTSSLTVILKHPNKNYTLITKRTSVSNSLLFRCRLKKLIHIVPMYNRVYPMSIPTRCQKGNSPAGFCAVREPGVVLNIILKRIFVKNFFAYSGFFF